MSLQSLATDPQYQAYLGTLEQQYGLTPGIIAAQQKQESGFNPDAVSPAGAVGIAQFMPATAKQYGIDPTDPIQSAQGQARMLSDLGKKYNGDIPSVLAAYNWGSGNLDRKGLANAPEETQKYISNIMGNLGGQQLQQVAQDQGGGALSKFASAIGNAIIPQAQAEEMPPTAFPAQDQTQQQQTQQSQQQPAQDYSKLSDQELLAEAQKQGIPVSAQQQDYSKLSDDQLLAEAQKQGINVSPKQSLGRQLGLTARDALQGVAYAPLALGDAITGFHNLVGSGINGVMGWQDHPDELPSQTFQKSLDTMGLPKPQTALERFVNSAATALAGAGTGIAAGQAVPELAPLAQNPMMQARAATGAGIASQGAAEAGGGPLVQMIAGMLGGGAAAGPKDISAISSPENEAVGQPKSSQEETILPMSAGQKTQNPAIQNAEADIIAGTKGSEAQKIANDFSIRQNEAMQAQISKLGEAKEGGNPADYIDNVSGIIKNNAEAANNSVDLAYKNARDLASRGENGDIVLEKKDIKSNLLPVLNTVAKDYTIDAGATPKANAILNRMKTLLTKNAPENITLNDLEGWRKAASLVSRNAIDPAEASAIRKMISSYDNYMSNAADRLPGQSAQAINAFKNAVSTRAQYAKQFQGNPLVENIVEGKTSVDDLSKQLLGSGTLGTKQDMLGTYQSLMRAAGDKAPQVQSQMQNAVAQRIYNNASKSAGKLPNSTRQAVSAARLKTELENVFVNQREFAKSLFGNDAVKSAQQVISELKQINSRQASVGNPSSTSYSLLRLGINGIGKGLSFLPGGREIGALLDVANKHIGNQKSARDATDLFTGTIPKKLKSKGAH